MGIKKAEIARMLVKWADAPLQSKSRKSILNRLISLRSSLSISEYLNLWVGITDSNSLRSGYSKSLVPLTPKQFLQPVIEFYAAELKGFEWVSILVGLPKMQNYTFFDDIVDTVNTIWAVQNMSDHFPSIQSDSAHEPFTRTIILQSYDLNGRPKTSVELIARLVYQTALIDLYHNYPKHYSGLIGERIATIQVQLFLNISSAFFENLQRFQPMNRLATPEGFIHLVADGNSSIQDEFIRLENENATALARYNHYLNLETADTQLYLS